MATSFREIATFMDPVDESIGLRHLATHHRWIGEVPSGSFAEMAERHTRPESVRLRFLWYNTFLMRVRLAVAKGLSDAATPREIMEALNVDPRILLEHYDVCNLLPSGPLMAPGPRELCKAAGDAVGFVINHLGGVDAVVNKIIEAIGAEKAIEIALRAVGVPSELELQAKPALGPRAIEIGDMLRDDGYHLAALCEVWNAEYRKDLVAHWQLPKSTRHLAVGQAEGDAFLGDGLLSGSHDGRIVEVQRRGYHTRGIDRTPGSVLDMLADDELWAQKAVLLLRIDVGVGMIDLYVTHLYFGTGLAGSDVGKFFAQLTPPNNSERTGVRSAQLEELGQFITDTHHSQHIAVVCGDFNIDASAHDPDYGGVDALQHFIASHNLEDRWLTPHADVMGSTGGDFTKICATSQLGDSRFCFDVTAVGQTQGYRIDYVLVEKPTAQHGFMLDVTRVRRRSFLRPQVTDDQAYMSDHLGLDCTFLASPKV